jgi:hypothetical protein
MDEKRDRHDRIADLTDTLQIRADLVSCGKLEDLQVDPARA